MLVFIKRDWLTKSIFSQPIWVKRMNKSNTVNATIRITTPKTYFAIRDLTIRCISEY